MSYTQVFGGTTLYPAQVSYRAIALAADTTISWPLEGVGTSDVAAAIMDVTPASNGLSITLDDATQVGPGYTLLFNNLGAFTYSVKNNAGATILSVGPGLPWTAYLADNSTAAGTWRVYQQGAGVSTVVAGALAGPGLKAISTQLAQATSVTTLAVDYTAGDADRAALLAWTGGNGTITLDPATDLGNDWFIMVRNAGSGTLTIACSGSDTIDGAASTNFAIGDSAFVVCSGALFYTVGFGQSATFAFDYTSIAVPGTGDYTLTGAELNRIAYRFTGILTGNRNIIVPNTVQQYWVTNDTTGAFTLTVKTAAGTGISITQGGAAIVYCDGTNVVEADTAGISTPVSVADGGTGATTPSSARTNLGATSVGNAVFTAASQLAARVAIGAVAESDAIAFAVALG